MQGGRIGNLVRRHHPRPEAAAALEILARRELVGVALPVADRAVVVAAVTGDMAERVGLAHMARRAADDDRQLALIVVGGRVDRPDHRCAVADLGIGPAGEQHGIVAVAPAGFLDMGFVVEADADDLVRIGNDRQQADIGERRGRPLPGGPFCRRAEQPAGQRLFQRRGEAAQVDHRVAVHGAPGRCVVQKEGSEFHSDFLKGVLSGFCHGVGQAPCRRSGGAAQLKEMCGRPSRDFAPERSGGRNRGIRRKCRRPC